MKVVAKITKDVALVEMEDYEFQKVGGFYARYHGDAPKMEVGTEVPIADIYDKATWVLKAYGDLKKALDTVKRTTTNLLRLAQQKEMVAEEGG